MSPRSKFLLSGSIIIAILQFTCGRASAQNSESDEIIPGKVFADIAIATNSVERGLTQTQSNPAVQAQLGYKWVQFRTGLWAGNVKYNTSPETSNLRLFLAYTFVFTRNANLTARYDFNRYYNNSTRDGAISSLDLNIRDYHITYETVENWEATEAGNVRYGFFKDWNINNESLWGLGAGYNMVGDSNLSNYFDLQLKIAYIVAEIKYELIGTYNSKPDQFQGRGGPYALVRFSASF